MARVRTFLAMVTVFAVALYGVVATASGHAHAHSGFHGVHVEVSAVAHDHDHDHDHDAAHRDSLNEPGAAPDSAPPPASEHHESGFHSHSAPQFALAEAPAIKALALKARRIGLPAMIEIAKVWRDDSPFKPPRTLR